MPQAKIVVTARVFAEVAAELRMLGDVVVNDAVEPWPAVRLRHELADADALMTFMPDRVEETLLRDAPRLRIVACALKGYDNFDVEACTRAGVWLTVVPDLLTEPTAELTIGLMIGVGRHLLAGDRLIRSGGFAGWRPQLYGMGLRDSRVGILGMGEVGKAIARRLRAFGARLDYWDRRRLPSVDEQDLGLCWSEREPLVRAADFLVLALPLTAETTHILDRDAIAAMKRGAILVNPARGSLVDEDAVAEMLEAGHLGGYAADVFEMEDWARPRRPQTIGSRLLAAPRTLFTPHLGSAVADARIAIERHAAASIADALVGRVPRGAVNRPVAR